MELFLGYLLLAAIAWYAIPKIFTACKSNMTGDDGTRHCMTCGTSGLPKVITKGSIFIEIFLWLCLIVPGLIYSIWRLSSRHKACPSCGSPTLVPVASPAAVNHRKILQA